MRQKFAICIECDGKGYSDKGICKVCEGSGQIKWEEEDFRKDEGETSAKFSKNKDNKVK